MRQKNLAKVRRFVRAECPGWLSGPVRNEPQQTPLETLPTERDRTARWALFRKPGFPQLLCWTALALSQRRSEARSSGLPVAWTDANAEPRSTNADARPAMVIAVVVVSPGRVIIVSDDHATITPGIPASAGVVTNQSCLVKQR